MRRIPCHVPVQIPVSTDIRPTRVEETPWAKTINRRRSEKHALTETVVRQWQLVWHVSQGRRAKSGDASGLHC